MLDIDETLTDAIKKVRYELEEDSKQWYKVVIHPSIITYDYRIAWTWEEMDKRNKWNNMVDNIRLAFRLPARPYWRPLYSEWTTHYWKNRPLLWNFGAWKTDLIPDRW